MSGGYISCGKFMGEDKSGSAISGVFTTLPECLPEEERESFILDVLDPLAEMLEETEDHFLIESDLAPRMLPPVEMLYARYGEELGYPEPCDAPQLDEKRGVNSLDAKWGEGIGWQCYCLHDLKIALQTSIETGDPVSISFD